MCEISTLLPTIALSIDEADVAERGDARINCQAMKRREWGRGRQTTRCRPDRFVSPILGPRARRSSPPAARAVLSARGCGSRLSICFPDSKDGRTETNAQQVRERARRTRIQDAVFRKTEAKIWRAIRRAASTPRAGVTTPLAKMSSCRS